MAIVYNRPHVSLTRVEEGAGRGTIAFWRVNGVAVAWNLEEEDRENENNVSSIPAQQYLMTWRRSPRFGMCWHVEDVPGRTVILVHIGNDVDDTEGCLLPGMTLWNGGVGSSKDGSKTLNTAIAQALGRVSGGDLEDGDTVLLTVREDY